MSKLQKLHDYLLGTKLVTADQLDVWETNSKTFSANTLDGSHTIVKRREFQGNILISNLTPEQDRDQIEFALIWWLNLYEPDHATDKERLLTDPDIKDSLVTNLWIGFRLTEKSRLVEGRVELCIKPLLIDAETLAGLPVWLVDAVSGEEELLGTLSDPAA